MFISRFSRTLSKVPTFTPSMMKQIAAFSIKGKNAIRLTDPSVAIGSNHWVKMLESTGVHKKYMVVPAKEISDNPEDDFGVGLATIADIKNQENPAVDQLELLYKAYQLIESACRRGYYPAMLFMAEKHLTGTRVSYPSMPTALFLFQACALGCADKLASDNGVLTEKEIQQYTEWGSRGAYMLAQALIDREYYEELAEQARQNMLDSEKDNRKEFLDHVLYHLEGGATYAEERMVVREQLIERQEAVYAEISKDMAATIEQDKIDDHLISTGTLPEPKEEGGCGCGEGGCGSGNCGDGGCGEGGCGSGGCGGGTEKAVLAQKNELNRVAAARAVIAEIRAIQKEARAARAKRIANLVPDDPSVALRVPVTVKTPRKDALMWFELAARMGSKDAVVCMGNYALRRDPPNYLEAFGWFLEAAGLSDVLRLRDLQDDEIPPSFFHLFDPEFSAHPERLDSEERHQLAKMNAIFDEKAVPADAHLDAIYNLATLLWDPPETDFSLAIANAKESERAELFESLGGLTSIPRARRTAFHLFLVAAERGDATAQFFAGTALIHGSRAAAVRPNFRRALQLIERSAGAGHGPAQLYLSRLYGSGSSELGVTPDARRSRYFLWEAANSGDPEALHEVAERVLAGEGMWGFIAKRCGAPYAYEAEMAQYNRGPGSMTRKEKEIYLAKGAPVPGSRGRNDSSLVQTFAEAEPLLGGYANPKDAFHLMLRAAHLGHLPSIVSAGAMYYSGVGTPQDPKAAFRLYSLAAQHGDTDAWRNIAEMYLTGVGVEKNEESARSILKMLKALEEENRRAEELEDQAEAEEEIQTQNAIKARMDRESNVHHEGEDPDHFKTRCCGSGKCSTC